MNDSTSGETTGPATDDATAEVSPRAIPVYEACVWPSEPGALVFPEQVRGLVPTEGATAICLSGGGTRALSAGLGQLRGLRALGLLARADYLSSVSGGSWASIPFTYYREGAASDDELLGPVRPPDKLTLTGLGELDPACLGHTATQPLTEVILKLLGGDVVVDRPGLDRIWIDAIGQVYLRPYGLDDVSYFTLDETSEAEIRSRNPGLAGAPFHKVRTQDGHRPYLVANTALFAPKADYPLPSSRPSPMSVFQNTPLGSGSPNPLSVDYGSGGPVAIGGGFVEPFAFGGEGPAEGPAGGVVRVAAPATPTTLSMAAGMSSAAFVAFDHNHLTEWISPRAPYWPVSAERPPDTRDFVFADGGSLENYGLLSMLQRRVSRAVVFINSETKLDLGYDPKVAPTALDIDDDLPPLFGYPMGDMVNNQVFAQSDFAEVVSALQTARRAGKSVAVRKTHKTVENKWWGIEAGRPVEVLWVYNDRVAEWEDQLEFLLKAAIDAGDFGPFAHFPNYKTVAENWLWPGHELVSLTKWQVNLLAHLTCWVVQDLESDLIAILT